MNDLLDFAFALFILFACLFIGVGCWAIIKQINMQTNVSYQANANTISVFRVNRDEK